MTIELPKTVRTYMYRPLTIFSPQDTDVDRVLPHLFEACVKGGRSAKFLTDEKDYPGYLDRLLNSEHMIGFDSPDARALVNDWLRTCIVDMGRFGRSHSGEQMLSVAPLTLAAYRAGVPKTRTRHRNIDDFAYQLLRTEISRRGSENPDGALRQAIEETIGRGIRIGPAPKWEPELTDPNKLDISELLEFRFLEGFPMGDARPFNQQSRVPDPLPGVARNLGQMLLSHLLVYSGTLPTAALMSSFAGLLALGVFTLSLRANAAGNTLLRTGEAPSDLIKTDPGSPLELYCDFTGGIDDESDKLSRQCVERDLNQMRLAFRERMTLMIIEKAVARIKEERERRDDLSDPDKLIQLARLREHQKVELFAMSQLDEIEANNPPDHENVTEDDTAFLGSVKGADKSELEKLLDVLDFVNQNKATRNSVAWFSSVGGLSKPHGILTGKPKSRRSWRYAPSDDLLQVLLMTVFMRGGNTYRSTMPLGELLDALRDRFGILIDRPPAFLDGVEARAAAAANLDAFKRRLQLLGSFESLSDDFSEQIVRHPLGEHHA